MPDPRLNFRNEAVVRAYECAQAELGQLPAFERRRALSRIASGLAKLDERSDVDAEQMALEAARIVAANRPQGPAAGPRLDEPRSRPSGALSSVRRLSLAPGAAVDARDSMPLVGGTRPKDWIGLADAFYGLAATIDRSPSGNVLAHLSLGQKSSLHARIDAAIRNKSFPTSITAVLANDQAAQLRSSAATILAELVDSLSGDTSARGQRLLGKALSTAAALAEGETDPVLRDSMVFGLYRLQTQLPEELRAITRKLMREIPPLTPPYAAWLEDGKVVVDLVVDGDAATVSGTTNDLVSMGFERVGDGDPRVFRGSFGPQATGAVIEVRVRESRDDIYANIDKPDVDVIWFSGHSNYGRAIATSLESAKAAPGTSKLIVADTCWGKDNMQQVRRLFPESELLTTFHGATYSDSMRAMRTLWDAVGGRKSWAAISDSLGGPIDGNWVTPADVMLRRRILDRDGDGRADALDRLYDVNLQHVESSVQRSFEPVTPEAPLHRLQELYGVIAASWVNRGVSGYNSSLHALNAESRVTSAGFFKGAPTDPPVRFAAATLPDGQPGWTLSVNHRFAHMPEEALRLVAAYELNLFLSANDKRFEYYGDPLRAKVNGLMAAAFTLSHDLSYDDDIVWKAFLRAYHLPDLDLSAIDSVLAPYEKVDSDAGCRAAVDAYIANLTASHSDLMAALSSEDAGTWPRSTSPESAGVPETLLDGELATVVHGSDPGDYYCEHAFFMGQEEAQRNGSTIVPNSQGEKLVGFLHVPRDIYLEGGSPKHSQAERHASTREVIGAALGGYVTEAAANVAADPVRVLVTGYDKFEDVVNNPTGDFVSHAENLDAAMQVAFGDRLLSKRGRHVAVAGMPAGDVAVEYRVRDAADGRVRHVQVLGLKLPVEDSAIDPAQAGSLPAVIRATGSHAVISMGVCCSEGKVFLAERHADSGGLLLEPTVMHDSSATASRSFADNYSLARAIASHR